MYRTVDLYRVAPSKMWLRARAGSRLLGVDGRAATILSYEFQRPARTAIMPYFSQSMASPTGVGTVIVFFLAVHAGDSLLPGPSSHHRVLIEEFQVVGERFCGSREETVLEQR